MVMRYSVILKEQPLFYPNMWQLGVTPSVNSTYAMPFTKYKLHANIDISCRVVSMPSYLQIQSFWEVTDWLSQRLQVGHRHRTQQQLFLTLCEFYNKDILCCLYFVNLTVVYCLFIHTG